MSYMYWQQIEIENKRQADVSERVVFFIIYYIKNGRRLLLPRYVLGYGINGPAMIIHNAPPTTDTKLTYIYWHNN